MPKFHLQYFFFHFWPNQWCNAKILSITKYKFQWLIVPNPKTLSVRKYQITKFECSKNKKMILL